MRSFKFFVRRNLINTYSNIWGSLGDLLSIVLNLIFFWYTSKAFGFSFKVGLSDYRVDYFNYVVLGEMVLLIPAAILNGLTSTVQSAAADGTLEVFFLLPRRAQTTFIISALAIVPKEVVRIILTLIIATLAFGFKFSYSGLGGAVFLQIISLPIFLGMGLFAASLLVFFGRGKSVISHGGNILYIFAGIYFPLSVLPKSIQNIAKVFSPFTILLESTRTLFSNGFHNMAVTSAQIIFWDLLLFFLGFWLLGLSFRRMINKGTPLIVN
jgi:ABC-2 type transport system permease protein